MALPAGHELVPGETWTCIMYFTYSVAKITALYICSRGLYNELVFKMIITTYSSNILITYIIVHINIIVT